MLVSLRDPLAMALWEARQNARTLANGQLPDGGLGRARAQAVASELYGALRSAGGHQLGWKFGATDRSTQEKLKTDRPFSAPVFSSTLLRDGALVSLQTLIAPRIEVEIALLLSDDAPTPLPCIEVIDSRFPSWDVSISEAMADFALQGCMIFGEPCADVASVDVRLCHDNEEVLRSSIRVKDAVASLSFMAPETLATGSAKRFIVATGSLVASVPLTAGTWSADFGELGSLRLEIGP